MARASVQNSRAITYEQKPIGNLLRELLGGWGEKNDDLKIAHQDLQSNQPQNTSGQVNPRQESLGRLGQDADENIKTRIKEAELKWHLKIGIN
jgi:hypothetical protein